MSATLDLLATVTLGLTLLYVRYRVLRPASDMAEALHEFARGNLDADLPPARSLGPLRAAIDDMRETARQSRAHAVLLAAERDALRTEAERSRPAPKIADTTVRRAPPAAPETPPGLKSAIVDMLRSPASGADRRKSARLSVNLPARLECRGSAFPGVVLNMSQGGVLFRQDAGFDVPVGVSAGLIIQGMPSVAVRVVGAASGLTSLAFTFSNPAERDEFATFVEEIAQMSVAA
jgi:HAMP domain-containing protein